MSKWTSNRHLRIGDRVVMNMDKEARGWGRKGPPNGTKGTIIGKYRATVYRERAGNDLHFYTPGIHQQDGVPIVHWDGHPTDITVKDGYSYEGPQNLAAYVGPHLRLEDISYAMEISRTSDMDMYMEDQVEAKRRYQTEWVTPVLKNKSITMNAQEQMLLNTQRIADLPETPGWEFDTIIPKNKDLTYEGCHLRIFKVQYNWIDREPHTYMVQWYDNETGLYARRGSTHLGDNDIETIIPGNVRRFYAGERLDFKSFEEEVSFAHLMGQAKDVRNPKTQLYSWTLEEALAAVKENLGQGFSPGSILPEPGDRLSVYRFTDPDLAQRLRSKVLEGFSAYA